MFQIIKGHSQKSQKRQGSKPDAQTEQVRKVLSNFDQKLILMVRG